MKYPKYVRYSFEGKTYAGKVLRAKNNSADLLSLEIEFITKISYGSTLKTLWNAFWPFRDSYDGALIEITEEEYNVALIMNS